ncbi:MAG: polysaccharide pyruvyl transferase family protein [Pseudomonadota bacterium]
MGIETVNARHDLTPRRIAAFNVKYSPNLGDGLLSICLEKQVARSRPDLRVTSFDLSGRDGFDVPSARSARPVVLAALNKAPAPLRAAATYAALQMLRATRLEPLWRRSLGDFDGVIVGGGNLMTDADLNFPVKVSAALRATAAHGLPASVFGVGVGERFSDRGRRLFKDALARVDLRAVRVRDAPSLRNWRTHDLSEGALGAATCRDPGVLIADYFDAGPRADHVSICLTDPAALQYHSAHDVAFATIREWFAQVTQALTAAGRDVFLFTNGSPEDRAFLRDFGPVLAASGGGRVHFAPEFSEPYALAKFIGSSSCIVAHRMHACIAAFSFGVPHIGLVWDPKLRGFFDSVDRSRFLLDPATHSPQVAAARIEETISHGVDREMRARATDEARDEIAELCDALVPHGSQKADRAGAP